MLFCSRPAHGHLYPLMPLVDAARAGGHEVVFATAEPFVSKLAALGIPTYPVGITIQEASAEAIATGSKPIGPDGRTDMAFGGRVFVDILARRTADDLLPLLHEVAPDVVVYGQFEFGAAVAAHVAGVTSVCHSVSPQFPRAAQERFGGAFFDRLWADYGVPVAPFDTFVGETFLDVFPACLQPASLVSHRARVAMRPVAWVEPGASMPAWVRGRRQRPLIYLTLGTMIANDDALRPAIEGLGTLDADVLVALGSAAGAELGPLPGNVQVEGFVDQGALMPHVDVVVHHGGSGTVLAALAHAVPQVLLPKGADQFLNAERMAAAGLAPVLLPAEATPGEIARVTDTTLNNPDRSPLDAVRAEIATRPHPAEIVTTRLAQSSVPRTDELANGNSEAGA